MHDVMFDFSKSRLLIASVYTAVMVFFLAEKLWLDYCYHVVKGIALPDRTVAKHMFQIIPLVGFVIWFSFAYGHGSPNAPPFSAVVNEMFFIGFTLYIGWSVGLFEHTPLTDFVKHVTVFVLLVGLFHALVLLTAARLPQSQIYAAAYSDWLIGSVVLAMVCVGFNRAVRECLGLISRERIWEMKDYINWWKDMLIYIVIGVVLLQGVLRIVLILESEQAGAVTHGAKQVLFAVFALGCLGGILVLGGVGDLGYLNSAEFAGMVRPRQELIRLHIYLRDSLLVVFAIGNGAWLFHRLFAR